MFQGFLMDRQRWLALWVGLLLCVSAGSAFPQIPSNGEFDYGAVEFQFAEHAIKSPVELSAGGWQPNGDHVPNFGFKRQAVWLRFTLSNDTDVPINRLLQVGNPVLDRVAMTLITPGQQHVDPVPASHIQGNAEPFTNRPIAHRTFLFPITVPAQGAVTVLLQVNSGNGVQVPLALWEESAFWQADQRRATWVNVYYGLMLAMICYNLFIVWGIRDVAYLYYVGTMTGVLLIQSILHGTAFQYLWPHSPEWNAMSIAVFIPLANALSSLFSNKMLRIRTRSPKLFWIIRFQILSAVPLAVASLIVPFQYVVPFSTFLIVVSASVVGFVGLRHWAHCEKDARIFTVAWNVFVLGCIALALSKFGLLEHNAFTANTMQVGSAIETMLLSLALAARINRLREDRMALEKNQLLARENELKAEQRLIEAKYESKAKSDFLAVMSHEIRTPMNGVLGVLDLLKDTPLSTQQTQMVGTIESSGKLLLNILNDILDLSKVESGKLDLESIPLSLSHIVADAVRIYEPSARQKNLVMASFVSPLIDSPLLGDPTRIKQILFNLVGNAIKFTERGHVFIRAQRMGEAEGRQHIRIEVIDSGIGLSDSAAQHLFESFTQAERSTSRKFGGTGLGLAISKKLVEAMGGEIGVTSQPHQGSLFWLNLPLARAAQAQPVELGGLSRHWVLSSGYQPLLHFAQDSLASLNVRIEAAEPSGPDAQAIRVERRELDGSTSRSAITQQSPFNLNDWADWHAPSYNDGATPREAATWPKRNIRVLVAEDNPVNQMVVRELLKPLVRELDLVGNGVDAVKRACADHADYDVIFMDCEMPEMDGYEATTRIREHEARANVVPVQIVALTAHAFEDFKTKAFAAGMDAHLTKPLNRATLAALLESLEEKAGVNTRKKA